MKLSELKNADLWLHMREELEEKTPEEENDLEIRKKAAISFCVGYTGLTEQQLDEYEDITIAVMMLVADLYDNRQLQIEKNTINKTAETILNLHCVNLL